MEKEGRGERDWRDISREDLKLYSLKIERIMSSEIIQKMKLKIN